LTNYPRVESIVSQVASRLADFGVVGSLALALSACASIEGLSQYEVCKESCDGGADARASITDATGADQTVESGGSPATDGPSSEGESTDAEETADGESGLPPFDAAACVDAMTPNTNIGVFVAPTGIDGTGCGETAGTPCASITAGLATAAGPAGRTIVYVAEGTYTEEVKLVPGVTVQGGWHYDGTNNWIFDCSANPGAVVTVKAPATSYITVLADTIGGAATLSTLTVLSNAAANVGESLYGIFVRGKTTTLTLTDVTVVMQNGGDGQGGTQGGSGAAAALASSKCAASDSMNSATPGGIGTGPTGDVYSSAGFTSQSGGTGRSGSAGDNGTAGGAGQTASYTVCTAANPCAQGTMTCTGVPGLNGCGGGGGLGGTGGSGGGSSIAIFAYDATVTVNSGAYTAGNGGHGQAGGAGGPGAPGSTGATSPTVCPQTSCASSTSCPVSTSSVTAAGGTAGGQGGKGSAGGQGGGGSGGDSYAIMTGGAATAALVLTGSPSLMKGAAGSSLGNGATGMAGLQGSF
jgi:hypothetical protein